MPYNTAHQVHQQPMTQGTDHCAWFLREARGNLALLRAMYGVRSTRYRRLLRIYRRVADNLGCRRRLERLAHVLRRQPPCEPIRWRPRSRSPGDTSMSIALL